MKIKGIKKAVGEFSRWQGQARIYLDLDDLEVWTDVYTGGNDSWTEHRKRNIVELKSKRFPGTDTITMNELRQLCLFELKKRGRH